MLLYRPGVLYSDMLSLGVNLPAVLREKCLSFLDIRESCPMQCVGAFNPSIVGKIGIRVALSFPWREELMVPWPMR